MYIKEESGGSSWGKLDFSGSKEANGDRWASRSYYATELAAWRDSRFEVWESPRGEREKQAYCYFFASLRTGDIIIFTVGEMVYDMRENY